MPSGHPPKWQRLGFKSEKAMEDAEFLANHPKEVKEVIKEAKEEDDLPSKGTEKTKAIKRSYAFRPRLGEFFPRLDPESILQIVEQDIPAFNRIC